MALLREGKEWILRHRENLVLLAGVLLVGALAFEGGLLRGALSQPAPLVISIPAIPAVEGAAVSVPPVSGDTQAAERPVAPDTGLKPAGAGCVFVGSRNSDKYHLSTCAVAKRIKPENRICFASKEEAEKRGYVPSCMK